MSLQFARLIVVLFGIVIGLAPVGAQAQLKVADAVAVRGAVHLGDELRAPAGGGARLRFTDGSAMSIGENTVITVHAYSQQASTRMTILEMLSGIFRAVVPPLTGDSVFAVRTPTAIAAVRSTDWMLATRSDLTEVFVGDGAVAVRNIDPAITAEVVLMNGDGTDVKPNEAPLSPRKWGPPRIRAFEERTNIN
jgi:hypothetical protein